MENQIDIDYLKGVFQRRKKTIVSVFFLIIVATVLIAVLLPPQYKSQVGIVVEEQQIPENYVQSTITSYVEERIEMISKQVMSRSRLMEIIEKHKLYRDMKGDFSPDEIVSEMRKNISIETLTADVGNRNSVTIGFNLSYSGRNPEKLRLVANELAYLYLEEEHKNKEKMASVTTDFLQQELNNFKEHIDLLENKISAYKQAHIGELPQNYNSNLSTLSRLENDFDRIDRNIRSLEERKTFLKTQIANVEPLQPIVIDGKNVMMNPAERLKRLRLELLSKKSTYSSKHPDIIKLQKEVEELEAQVGGQDASTEKVKRLADLQGKLAALRAKYGEKHPDVIAMTKEYDVLSREVDKLMTAQIVSEVSESKPDNPVYINLMTQIVTIDSQIEGYLEEKAKLETDIEVYRQRIENSPLVEKEYSDLTRDHGAAMRKYNDLLSKLMQARVAQGMESSQRGERFRISDPASYPGSPYKPNRKIILVLGVLLAIAASVGLTALQEALDTSLKSASELVSSTGLPVFSVFPMIKTREEKRRTKRKHLAMGLGCCLLVAIGIILVDRMIMPLDVIWAKTMYRLAEIGAPVGVFTQ